jgi:hypothetical protein
MKESFSCLSNRKSPAASRGSRGVILKLFDEQPAQKTNALEKKLLASYSRQYDIIYMLYCPFLNHRPYD